MPTTDRPAGAGSAGRVARLALAALLVAALSTGCESKKHKQPASAPAVASRPVVLPQYRFVDDTLPAKFPDAAAFVREFLETCLTGDYAAYRRLVSRHEEPQSRERFERLYANLRLIDIETIEPLKVETIAGLPWPTGVQRPDVIYLIVSSVHFDPQANISLRHRERKIAILAFAEDGVWRMRPAPSRLQPREGQRESIDPSVAMRTLRRRMAFRACILAPLLLAVQAAAQSEPASAPSQRAATSQPAQLSRIEDFSFSYAQPDVYALLERVREQGIASAGEPLAVTRWTDLLERSADYRGKMITVTGVIGRNSPWRLLDEQYAHLGVITELQLQRDDQPISCKCLLVGEAADLPLGAEVTVSGVYVMIQQYYSEARRLRQAAVLVGVGPSQVVQSVKKAAPQRSPTVGLVAAACAALVIVWLILRRTVSRRESVRLDRLRAEHPAPRNLSEELTDWAQRDDPSQPDTRRDSSG
ncbi:MAG: hypothetical protein HZB38_14310 [Planctomycetes bacterium]|nr:hypothetical protein [Planctomycetota bacterium]